MFRVKDDQDLQLHEKILTMKQINYIIITIAMLSFYPSCDESTIDLAPIGETEATYFMNEKQMTEAVLGIYQKLSFFYTFRANAPLCGITLLPDDDLTTPGDASYERFISLTPDDARLGNYFKFAYQLINRANTVLSKIEENGDLAYTASPELKGYHRGEALFLRAWMNYKLYVVYGSAAPLVTERITLLEDAYPPSSTGTQLLDQAIADLQEASSLLPAAWDAANLGRVTKNSAFGLMVKILVIRGTLSQQSADFTGALTAFNSISGLSLMPGFGDNFAAAKENNAESLFEYQANEQSAGTNPFLDNDGFDVIGDLTHWLGWTTQSPDWVGTNYFKATASLINAYEPGDPRIGHTFNPAGTTTNVLKYTKDGLYDSGWAGSSYNCNVNNPRLLRYADVLLLKSEALVRSGGSKIEAIGLVNQIRERARKSTADGSVSAVPADRNVNETNTATILNWIFQERRLELAFEEGARWVDLKRRHLAGEINLTSWDFSSIRSDFAFKTDNLVFPLPQSEVSVNKNLTQNTGY